MSPTTFDLHERGRKAVLERWLEGLLGMFLGAVLMLAAYRFASPADCIIDRGACVPSDWALLVIGGIVFVASLAYMIAGSLYCWRCARYRFRCGERRWRDRNGRR